MLIFARDWKKNEVVHFGKLMWIAIGTGGEVSYCLIEPNNFQSFKAQSLASRSLGLDMSHGLH